jgi:tmRNA-binding protein
MCIDLRGGLFARHVVSNGTNVNVYVKLGMAEYILMLVFLSKYLSGGSEENHMKTRHILFKRRHLDPTYHKHETEGLTIKPTYSVTELSVKDKKNGGIASQLLYSVCS